MTVGIMQFLKDQKIVSPSSISSFMSIMHPDCGTEPSDLLLHGGLREAIFPPLS
jgi:hypothetical protein